MKLFKLMCCLACLALVMFTATLALAADAAPATNAFGAALSAFCTNTLLPLLGALTLGFASWAAKKLGDKYKIAGLSDSNGFLMQVAAQGVAFAEEKAANFAKNAQPLTGNDKLNAAIAYMLQNAPKVTEAQAQSLVTAALASLPGVGATGSASVTVPPVVPVVVDAPAVSVPVEIPLPASDPLAIAP
jgi:hypothetical protein